MGIRYIDTQRILDRRYDRTAYTRSASTGLLPRLKAEYYHCPHCGHATPKDEATISGFDSQNSLRHIHCPSCGRVMAWPSRGFSLRGAINGACLTVVGGALAFLLYPFLNTYAFQAGLYTSIYGILKILGIT